MRKVITLNFIFAILIISIGCGKQLKPAEIIKMSKEMNKQSDEAAKHFSKGKELQVKKKHDEHELMCQGHILNTISNRLYDDLFIPMKSTKHIWNTHEFK